MVRVREDRSARVRALCACRAILPQPGGRSLSIELIRRSVPPAKHLPARGSGIPVDRTAAGTLEPHCSSADLKTPLPQGVVKEIRRAKCVSAYTKRRPCVTAHVLHFADKWVTLGRKHGSGKVLLRDSITSITSLFREGKAYLSIFEGALIGPT